MRFTDFPRPLPAELYEEAADAYVKLVSKRVHAVYRTGSVRDPGISDLDLIVVPVGSRYDNYAYFSTRRLTERLRGVFRHEPFVLPVETRGVIRYTMHKSPHLLHGQDVLPSEPYQETLEDSWSMLLEDYCRYHRFMRTAARADEVSVRFLLSKLGSISIPIGVLNTVASAYGGVGLPHDDSSAEREQLRAMWFLNRVSPESKAAETWKLLCGAFDQLTLGLSQLLNLSTDDDLARFTRDFLRGERSIAGVDPALVRARQEAVFLYLKSLCTLRINFEPLVPNTLFHREIAACRVEHWPHRSVRAIVKLRYALERAARQLRVPTTPAVAAD